MNSPQDDATNDDLFEGVYVRLTALRFKTLFKQSKLYPRFNFLKILISEYGFSEQRKSTLLTYIKPFLRYKR